MRVATAKLVTLLKWNQFRLTDFCLQCWNKQLRFPCLLFKTCPLGACRKQIYSFLYVRIVLWEQASTRADGGRDAVIRTCYSTCGPHRPHWEPVQITGSEPAFSRSQVTPLHIIVWEALAHRVLSTRHHFIKQEREMTLGTQMRTDQKLCLLSFRWWHRSPKVRKETPWQQGQKT